MKKSIYIISILAIVICTSFIANNQCDDNKYKTECLEKLGDGFTFLKSYSLKKEKSGEMEYSFVFSKNINYMLTYATDVQDESKVEIMLFDKNKKLLFSNYNKKKNLFYTVNYPCSYTGIHYIKFKHHNDDAKCGLSVLAFKRR